MIDIFFDYFGYDKEHLLVASIAYEYDDHPNRIITINRNNIIVLRGGLWFFNGLNGFLSAGGFGTCLICAGGLPKSTHQGV